MKVLIADFDLFAKFGGGQTFYRSIISKNPQIDFYYLREKETTATQRPANAHTIPYKQQYLLSDLNNFFDVIPPKWIYRSFVLASNIAASVAGGKFDIVDFPDYEQFGTLLRPALKYHGVEFDKIAASLHGKISTTLRLDWFNQGKGNIPLDLEEKMQYKTVDLRYGISKTYLDQWRELVDLEAYYYHPLHFIDLPKPTPALPSAELPTLNFIGRTEKRKGPDIFIDLAWWLPRSSYSKAQIIGPHSYSDTGKCSKDYLEAMLGKRLYDISLYPPMTRPQLAQLFASKSITFLPSRYDTLNLLALESLFSGCPTAIGTGAGVCRFLQETFPQVPFITIDINNIYSCLPDICAVLDNYEEYRHKLVDSLFSANLEVSDPILEEIYNRPSIYEGETREQLDKWYAQLMGFWESTQTGSSLLASPPAKWLKSQLKPAYKELKQNLKDWKQEVKAQLAKPLEDTRLFQTLKGPFLLGKYKGTFNASEQTEEELANKVQECWRIGETFELDRQGWRSRLGSGFRIDRVRLWREIARIEELRGNDLVAATYKLRGVRLLGRDRFGDLPFILRTIAEKGFSREAKAVEAMYGNSAETDQQCREIIEKTLLDNLHNRSGDYELVDDRRDKSAYRASVIVSLYNAAAKLPLFLRTLQHQTLIQAGEAEIILIDSGSPGDERAVFQQLAPELNIPIIYARSSQRETIQSAWNRGISLSRAPYLSFLGVDEAILPECLAVLAGELDRDPTIDWVMANSLVTNVDKQGSWVSDIMLYDRKGYKQDLIYLETCYLSWVGGLYRRSLHDRFGYYDPTFRGAGDTEFKNRILPFIKSKAIDRTLGVFWNYPDERTTQSPLAELEDMRAWYLHRTLPGIRYAFSDRDPEEAEKQLYSALCYRKSYCTHWSTDLEYAYNLSLFIQEIKPDSRALKYFEGIKTLLQAYRDLDWLPKISRFSPLSAMIETRNLASQIEREHQNLNNDAEFAPNYRIFNDNRHEQHAFLWFTDIDK